MPQNIYLDNASTTAVDPRVLESMIPYFTEKYGNPSSTHRFGQEAHVALNNARRTVADFLDVPQEDVIFTGGASEAINMVIKGIARSKKDLGRHIVASSFEHSTTLAALRDLVEEGWDVSLVSPNAQGMIESESFLAACRADTTLAVLMAVQNEVGTVQPLGPIAHALHQKGIAFHVDGAQAVGSMDCHLSHLPVSSFVLAAHKFHGPKGIAALYLHPSLEIPSLVSGSQEFGRRAGTQNVPLAVGMQRALELHQAEAAARRAHLKKIHAYAREEIFRSIPDVHFHIHENTPSTPHILSVAFPGTSGESLLRRLDLDGIAVSTAAACAAGSGRVSHVLTAMGIPEELAQATLRISFSHRTTTDEIDALVLSLAMHVGQIRHMNITY